MGDMEFFFAVGRTISYMQVAHAFEVLKHWSSAVISHFHLGQNTIEEREELQLDLLMISYTTIDKNWIIWGDFNEMLTKGKRLGSETYMDDGLEAFRKMMVATGLAE